MLWKSSFFRFTGLEEDAHRTDQASADNCVEYNSDFQRLTVNVRPHIVFYFILTEIYTRRKSPIKLVRNTNPSNQKKADDCVRPIRDTNYSASQWRATCARLSINQRWRWLWAHIAAVERTPRFVQQLWWRLKENYSYKPCYKDYRTYFDFLTRFSLWLFLKPRSSNFLCKFSSANRRAIYKFDLNILILFLFLFKFKYLRWQISV